MAEIKLESTQVVQYLKDRADEDPRNRQKLLALSRQIASLDDSQDKSWEGVVSWWKQIQEDRGALATLRKCSTPNEVRLKAPELWVSLLQRTKKRDASESVKQRVAILAVALVLVPQNSNQRLGLNFLGKNHKEPDLSPGRLQALLSIDSEHPQDLMRGITRALKMV